MWAYETWLTRNYILRMIYNIEMAQNCCFRKEIPHRSLCLQSIPSGQFKHHQEQTRRFVMIRLRTSQSSSVPVWGWWSQNRKMHLVQSFFQWFVFICDVNPVAKKCNNANVLNSPYHTNIWILALTSPNLRMPLQQSPLCLPYFINPSSQNLIAGPMTVCILHTKTYTK